jgi:hypothetical protein
MDSFDFIVDNQPASVRPNRIDLENFQRDLASVWRRNLNKTVKSPSGEGILYGL